MIVIRLSFLVSVIIAANFVQCIDLGESGLVFNAGNAYASTYHNYKPRDYQFEYAVSDPHTGDHKSQWETKDKGVVRGAYSLLEPDGTTRIVEYIADDDGFRAVVKKIGIAIHPSGHAQEVSEVQYHGTAPHETAAPGLGVINVTPVGYPTFNTYSGRAENYGETIDDSKYLQIQKLLEIPQLEAVPQLQQHQAITLDQQHQILPTVPLNQGYQNQEILYQPTVQNLQGHAPEYYPLEYSQKLKFEAPVQYRTVLQEVPKTLQLEPQVQYSAQYQAQPEQYQAQPEVSWKGSEQWKGVPIQIQDVPNVEYQQQVQIQQAPRTPYEIPLAYYRKPSLSESLNLGQKQQINVAVQSLHPHGESSTNFVGSNNYAGEYSNHRLSAVPYQGQGQWEKPLMPYDFVINHPVLQ